MSGVHSTEPAAVSMVFAGRRPLTVLLAHLRPASVLFSETFPTENAVETGDAHLSGAACDSSRPPPPPIGCARGARACSSPASDDTEARSFSVVLMGSFTGTGASPPFADAPRQAASSARTTTPGV
ncbi:hypothetical protein LSCM1_01526 [Leishmania martiniquensis]|uniref:Uncharacterized protein n=1 Tax=Leishmania martiniquensis TaxID=1580590 RepID=A0A836GX84_9TRYP|nr:hypothetical protein LSCM1_01526 [Leishmania martiniquensis]